MPAVEIVNYALAALSILFGALAFFWPDYALKALSLEPAEGRMDGKSELRGASGGAFVVLGAVAGALGPVWPLAWVMMGVHYAGAAAGRALSFVFDGSGSRKMQLFLAIEIAFAAWLIGANWPRIV